MVLSGCKPTQEPRVPRGIELDLSQQKFGKWTVLRKDSGDPRPGIFWKCRCDCGEIRLVKGSALYNGETKGCGCDRTKTHGMSKTKTFKSWDSMKQRCLNPNSPDYPKYGGRGVKICERWLDSFENFYADMGDRPEGKSIDRIDNDGNYEPANCRWATRSEQQMNKRFNTKVMYKGTERTIFDLSQVTGVTPKVIRWRLDNNWAVDLAVDTPVRFKRR